MTTLYFIRHGETAYNINKIRQGTRIDEYLDTQGILQTEQLAKLVEALKLDAIITSHLRRAEETAAIIEEKLHTKIPVIHDYRFRERDFGSLSGKTVEEWNAILPDHREKENMQTYDYRPFGGESVDQVRERVIGAVLDAALNYEGKNVGIITHGGVIRLLLFHFPEIPRIYKGVESNKDVSNADIYEWEVTDGRIKNLKSLLR